LVQRQVGASKRFHIFFEAFSTSAASQPMIFASSRRLSPPLRSTEIEILPYFSVRLAIKDTGTIGGLLSLEARDTADFSTANMRHDRRWDTMNHKVRKTNRTLFSLHDMHFLGEALHHTDFERILLDLLKRFFSCVAASLN